MSVQTHNTDTWMVILKLYIKNNNNGNRSCYTGELPFKVGKSDQDLTLHHMCAVHMDQTAHMLFYVKANTVATRKKLGWKMKGMNA